MAVASGSYRHPRAPAAQQAYSEGFRKLIDGCLVVRKEDRWGIDKVSLISRNEAKRQRETRRSELTRSSFFWSRRSSKLPRSAWITSSLLFARSKLGLWDFGLRFALLLVRSCLMRFFFDDASPPPSLGDSRLVPAVAILTLNFPSNSLSLSLPLPRQGFPNVERSSTIP